MAAEFGPESNAQRLAELAALVDAVKQRVRAQYPENSAGAAASGGISVALPDLTPLARARDAAAGKMAAIGTVNPRAGGPVNAGIQSVKRTIARALNWFVRDQVIFNRQVIGCIETCIETLADINRSIYTLSSQANHQIQQVRTEAESLKSDAAQLRNQASDLQDLASHWSRWREEWQLKLHRNEVEFLKSLADLNTAFQQRFTRVEAETAAAFVRTSSEFEAGIRRQHDAFERLANSNAEAIQRSTAEQINALAAERRDWSNAMDRRITAQAEDLQKSFYADLDRIRAEYERIIHAELRTVRQRLAVANPAPQPQAAQQAPAPAFDYARFAERFRGSDEYVTESQRFYVPYFTGRRHVVDLGCGRGEFLGLMKEAGVPARGIESSTESVAWCRSQGLDADTSDLFSFLADQTEGSFDGIFCSQVVEHLPPDRLPEMVRLCASRLATGGVLAIETPNPECLAIFATHFYLDPTHTRPVPAQLLAFYMEEFGMGRIQVRPKAPAIDSMPEVGELPEAFRQKFFNGLDYAIIGYKL